MRRRLRLVVERRKARIGVAIAVCCELFSAGRVLCIMGSFGVWTMWPAFWLRGEDGTVST
jgi:hypothetical protein